MKNGKKFLAVFLSLIISISSSVCAFAVQSRELEHNVYATETKSGDLTSNAFSSADYNYFGKPDKFYLHLNDDGTEYEKIVCSDSKISIDRFTADFEYILSTSVTPELPLFGGYYHGTDYNFIVFGQNNLQEDDGVEVLRIVKYTYNWQRVDSLSIYGANTTIPFRSGSCRMCDDGTNLYIQTCHQMYKSSDGLNHQANFQLNVRISDMESIFSSYGIANISCGYCSHSFDQYVRTSDGFIYSLDLGDAYPRSVVLCKKTPSGNVQKYTSLLSITGAIGDNATGVTLGGLEIFDNNCVAAGLSCEQVNENKNLNIRNVFVSITDKNLDSANVIWLSENSETYGVQKPKIIKIDDSTFYVVWNQYNEQRTMQANVVKMNENGDILGRYTIPFTFSECTPILVNGKLVWFTSNKTSTNFYHVSPENYEPVTDVSQLFLYRIDDDGNAVITGLSQFFTEGELRIPSVIDGHTVTEIVGSAFSSNKKITSAVIPSSVKSIGEKAFNSCTKLESLSIGNGVETIGKSAFTGCTKLASAVIPGNIKTIPESAFQNCSSLQSVTVLDGCETIGTKAFYNCTNLSEINLPDSVSSIGASCFSGCILEEFYIPKGITAFSSNIITGCNTVKAYNVSSEHPTYSSVDGVLYSKDMKKIIKYPAMKSDTEYIAPASVTTVESAAFSSCKNLTSAVFTDSLVTINSDAFEYCTNLQSIDMGTKLSTIGTYVFDGCSSLDNVVIPRALGYINTGDFRNCTSLKNITISKNIFYMSYYVFQGCTSLESISISCQKFYPSGFSGCTNLKNVELSSSFTSIPSQMFYNCTSLETITIPAGVTSVESSAFYNCTSLTDVYYAGSKAQWNSITIAQDNDPLLNAAVHCAKIDASGSLTDTISYTFDEKTGLLTISGTGEMPDYASAAESPFAGNSKIKEIDIKMGITAIGTHTFENCSGLEKITTPYSVIEYRDSAFHNCNNVTEFNIHVVDADVGDNNEIIDECNPALHIFEAGMLSDNIFVEETLLDDGTYRCTFVGTGDMPSYDLSGDNNTPFVFDSDISEIIIEDGITSIGDYSFILCSIKKITVADSVKYIGEGAFYLCPYLEDVELPADITLGDFALTTSLLSDDVITFRGENPNYIKEDGVIYNADKTELVLYRGDITAESFTVPETVTRIAPYAFWGGLQFKSVVLPDGLEYIGQDAFNGCEYLESINIPESVTYIGYEAFDSCESLREITIPGTVKTIGEDVFFGCDSLESVILEEGITSISNGMFRSCENLTDISIPESVTYIGKEAFENSDSLKNILIPGSVETFGDNAFYGCDNLEKVAFEKGIKTLPNGVFNYCPNLTEVLVPNSVETLSPNIFYDNSITSITLPNSIKTIDENAFSGCYYLTDIYYLGTEEEWNQIAINEDEYDYYSDLERFEIHFIEESDEPFIESADFTLSEIDGEKFISGFTAGETVSEFDSFIANDWIALTYTADGTDVIGTGSRIILMSVSGEKIEYTAVVYGDVNGDGRYDGTDSVITNCIFNGLLSEAQTGKAVYMAADCNHDDAIDENDVALLEQAGLLLASIDQSKSPAELFEDALFSEYINLIDQTPVTAEKAVEEAPTDTTPVVTKTLLQKIIDFIIYIFKLITSYIPKVF